MFTFPLHKQLYLLIDHEIYKGIIVHAGKDALIVEDFYKRVYTDPTDFFDVFLNDRVTLKRNLVQTYWPVKNNKKKIYNMDNKVIQLNNIKEGNHG